MAPHCTPQPGIYRPSCAGEEALGSTPLDSWGGWLGYGGSRGMAANFGLGWGRGHGGMWYSSPQEPTQTLCFQSCPASCTFCNPSISNCCTSSHSTLAILVNPVPGKEKRSLSQRPDLAIKSGRTSRKAKQCQAKRHTWPNNPWASSIANAGTPPTSTHDHTQSTSYSSFVVSLASSSSDDSSADETIPNEQRGIWLEDLASRCLI